ncbi:MAG TPA: glycosyltransferase family 1 protein [Candidatus Andersenbacteria bacterium]|nr:glycosyltransferase family 1 protein [Candidatus Andersenbacteria bacterium]
MKKSIGIITNASPDSGVGKRAHEIFSRLPMSNDLEFHNVFLDGSHNMLSIDGKKTTEIAALPGILNSKSISWLRLAKKIPQFNGYDISNQSLSFIAKTHQPSIITVHDVIERTHPQSAGAAFLNRYLMSGIPHARHIVAVSEYVKRTIIDAYNITPEYITVIYNGVDKKLFFPDTKKKQASEKGPVILFVGSEHPRKNLKTALQVIKQLQTHYPNILLVKVGDPGLVEGRREMLRLIDEYQLQSHVHVLGKVSNEQLHELYQSADVLLMPSYFEGFGMPIIEAMASGCPVVCSNTTSLPEIAGDAAILCDPQDASSFTDAIQRIISNENMRNEYIEKGLERASLFSWNTAAQQTYELYKKYL